jgi:hypothetical protein
MDNPISVSHVCENSGNGLVCDITGGYEGIAPRELAAGIEPE